MSEPIKTADFIPLPPLKRGKVRDLFDLGNLLLIVSTEWISAFDVVFDELIPDKGIVLNGISAFWFEKTRLIADNHLISTDPADYPPELGSYRNRLQGRSMLVEKLRMLPCECIVRGYLEGSAQKKYRQYGIVGSLPMPPCLRQADRLPQPVFTHSTKEETGHDVNLSFETLKDRIGSELAEALRGKSLALYRFASDYAEERGLIIADTKFEFSLSDGRLKVADELLTPDSSRIWDRADYVPGRAQKSFDKQYLRDWLETQDWDKNPPPHLSEDVIMETARKYREAYRRITGQELA